MSMQCMYTYTPLLNSKQNWGMQGYTCLFLIFGPKHRFSITILWLFFRFIYFFFFSIIKYILHCCDDDSKNTYHHPTKMIFNLGFASVDNQFLSF